MESNTKNGDLVPRKLPAKPAASRNKAFTLAKRRLSGSPACLNCGTELMGPFCYYCGQPDKNLLRFFPALVRDLLEDVVDFDSRFMRTLKPLLFHPGKLTRDYLDGRRFRYVPPMRLYIFSSMAFFIIAALMANQEIEINSGADGKSIHINIDPEKDSVPDAVSREIQEAVSQGKLSKEDAESISGTLQKAMVPDDTDSAPGDAGKDHDQITFGDKPWNRETNPLNIPFLPDFVNEWINDEIEKSPQKGREIEANPNLIVDKIFDVLPAAVFVMLPLVAILFKFWYLFARKYYVEHLIHALHNHAFLFVVFTLALLSDKLAEWLDPAHVVMASKVSASISVALLCWIPLYLLLSLKTVYRQGWGMTLTKFSVIGISYVVLLAFITSIVAILSFLLL